MDDREIDRQAELVTIAFVPQLPDGGERTAPLGRGSGTLLQHRTLERTLAAAVDRILSRWVPATAVAHPGTFWGPVVTTSDAAQWSPGSLGYDLYGGSLGVALALAEAGHLVDLPRARDAVAGVVEPVRAQLLSGALAGQPISAGGMTGMGGTVWAIAATDRLSGRGSVDHARLVDVLTDAVREDTVPDFTAGLAGALAAACGIVERVGTGHRDAAVGALAGLSRRVLPGLEAEAFRVDDAARGAARTLPDASPVFTGYAHGLAGVVAPTHRAAALLSGAAPELSARLSVVGATLLARLLEQIGPDGSVPRTIGRSETSWAWCHGAPGILQGLLEVAATGVDVPVALLLALGEQTQARGVGNNPTSCHGDLGSLAALHRLAVHLGDGPAERRWAAETRSRAAATAVRDASARDRYAATDSLMVGRAGAVHALVRSTDPTTFPDVLSLG